MYEEEFQLIKQLSLDLAGLVTQGVQVRTSMPEYLYTDLAAVKEEVQALAAQDAMQAAFEANAKERGAEKEAELMKKFMSIVALPLVVLAMMVGSVVSAYADATVYVVHGIPDVDVDIAVNGDCLLPNFMFGDQAGPAGLVTGPQTGTVVAVKIFIK